MKINWSIVKEIAKILGIIFTTIAGTTFVQSCVPTLVHF
jgi:hypothetical protein